MSVCVEQHVLQYGACPNQSRTPRAGLDESVLRVYSLSAGGARSGDISIAQQVTGDCFVTARRGHVHSWA